ncbi:Tim44/TimA family putative adaptor protein [uncultured Nitratireductor sp.]|uniref:Tim44/TimA family putative adaptor protein n=1 Tax=uncultured Nitratireductor sp. TaxID=520953 RepID=UPI0025CDA9CF|nr:Tim44/TimA family putative adaptor protein [uncultured Nitratireductor sp.]
MNEVMDGATGLPGIILFWLWWVFLTFLEAATRDQDTRDQTQPTQAMADTVIEYGTTDTGIAKIRRFDPSFDLDMFVYGARHAYEIIVSAFAAGDLDRLEPLVSEEILAVFAEHCAARASRGECVDLALIGIESIDIVQIDVCEASMEVTLCFNAQMIWVERSAEGLTVSGNPAEIIDVVEAWTFARPLPVVSNSWELISTGD